jgi:phosphatidyl-myo-inositol dimannoside synthase
MKETLLKFLDKILIVTSEFPPGPGGIGNHSYNLAKNLSEKGHDISVLVISKYLFPDDKFYENCSFQVIKIQNNNLIRYFKLLFHTTKHILINRKVKFIISGHLPVILFGNIFRFYSKDIIGIIHGHEILMGGKIIKFFTKKSLLKMDTLVAVSKFSKDKVLEAFNHPKIEIIRNGFDKTRFEGLVSKENLNMKNINLITVGSVSKRKGQRNVIKALPTLKLKYPSIKYHMIGNINIKNEIKTLVSELKVEENVKFHGYLNDEKLSYLMNHATIFVMLSENLLNGEVEGFGIAILEANHFGLPVIGSQKCGIEDAVKDRYSGILIDNKDINHFVNAIDDIINNYEKYVGRAKHWSKKFHWEDVIDNYINLIDKQ